MAQPHLVLTRAGWPFLRQHRSSDYWPVEGAGAAGSKKLLSPLPCWGLLSLICAREAMLDEETCFPMVCVSLFLFFFQPDKGKKQKLKRLESLRFWFLPDEFFVKHV